MYSLFFGYLSAQLAYAGPSQGPSVGVQAALIGDGQNDESVTPKNELKGGLCHVVLGTMDVTDSYPYLQVQLKGKGVGWVPLMKSIVSETGKN